MNELFGKESAQAIGKVADAGAKVVDVGHKFGTFCSRYLSGPIEQWTGLWQDKLKYRRWENQVALMSKAEAKIKELGLEGRLRPLEMKIGVPLLEAVSLEDDPDIQEIWARMLVNAVDPNQQEIKRGFITILDDLEKKDILIFNEIYTYRQELIDGTRGSEPHPEGKVDPEQQSYRDRTISQAILKKRLEQYQTDSFKFSDKDVEIGLWNLIRLGCLNQISAWGGLTIARVEYTPLGIALFEACYIGGINNPQ